MELIKREYSNVIKTESDVVAQSTTFFIGDKTEIVSLYNTFLRMSLKEIYE